MKTLNFTEENKESYDTLFEAVRVFPLKGIEEILLASTVVEKLKTIGAPSDESGKSKILYKLFQPASLELEDEHFKYIKRVFAETQWSTSMKVELLAQTAQLLKSIEAG